MSRQGKSQTATGKRLPVCAFDWSHKGVDMTVDGQLVERVPDLPAMLDRLATPHLILGEATFESFHLEKRKQFVDECKRRGHDLRVINPRGTEIERKREGIRKSDDEDARTLWRIATNGRTHLKKPSTSPVSEDYKARFEEARMDMVRSRNTRDGYAPYIEHFQTLFPDADETHPDVKLLCLTKTGYSGVAISTCLIAARYARNRNEFDRITGLYMNGYPSQARSNIVFHRGIAVVYGDKRRVAGRKPLVKHNRLRNGARAVFHAYKAEGKSDPAEGKMQPRQMEAA